MESFSIFSVNVNGLRNHVKRKSLFKKFKEYAYDIICLQETFITDDVASTWKQQWGGEMIYSTGTGRSKGQIILFKKNLDIEYEILKITDRIILLQVKCNDNFMYICNAYAPNSDADIGEFLNSLSSLLYDVNPDKLVLCGDFNSVVDNNIDIISGEKHSDVKVDQFNNFIHINNLYDIWRLHNLENKEFTWSRVIKGSLIARRLDYILVSDNTLDDTLECHIISLPTTDHRGVLIKLKTFSIARGPGYWKLNNALLQEQEYLNLINTTIDNFSLEFENQDADVKWELLKLRIKETTLNYSRERAVKYRNKTLRLQAELNDIDILLAKNPDNSDSLKRREQLLINLELLEYNKTKSAQIRSKEKWISEGEKNTKFFLSLEKSRANAKIMPSLTLENDTVLTDQLEILNAQKEYFENLYKVDDNVIDDSEEQLDIFLNNADIPKLSDEESRFCEGKTTFEELGKGLKQLNNGSSPGIDGLSTEFYKVFWGRLGHFLTSALNVSYDKGELSYTQNSAVITLIHKSKELPKNKLTNWRPISLTNSDYKILAKTLALRLMNVIDSIVDKDQSAYIRHRDISNHLQLINDVIDYLKVKHKPGILLALDFSKAFDSISRKFLLTAFKRFGFGTEFIKWVSVLMENNRSSIIYNGWVSESFHISRGIRQGCPFSALAFIIGIEYLAIRVRSQQGLTGIDLNSNNTLHQIVKIILYADDVTLLLRDRNDVRLALDILNQFRFLSGLQLNITKSQAMWLGSNTCFANEGFGLSWNNEIKVLGIYFSNSTQASLINKNWLHKIEKIKRIMKIWEKRNLGLIGKITILKSFISAQFTYLMKTLVLPDNILTELNTLVFRFLWRKKDCNRRAYEKVKRKVMINDREKGGLKMIDFRIMQQSFQLEKLVKLSRIENDEKWSWIPKLYFMVYGRNFSFLNSTIGSKSFKGLETLYESVWKEHLKVWLSLNKINSIDNRIKSQCLWNNSNIRYQNNVVYFRNWALKGVSNITDVLDANNNFVSLVDIENLVGRSANIALQYRVMQSAVNSFLRLNPISENNEEGSAIHFNDMQISAARNFNTLLKDSNYSPPCSINFWKNKYSIELDKRYWLIAYNSTKEVRLQELHFKILHNIYPTNILLSKIGIRLSNKCTFCPNQIDFIEHFFFWCPKINPVWQSVSERFTRKFSKPIVLSETEALLGLEEKEDLNKIMITHLNHLILIAKMSIGIYKYRSPLNINLIFEKECIIRNI